MPFEEWRPVPEFKNYQVTESFKIRDVYNLDELKISTYNGTVLLYRNGSRYRRSVAKIVKQAFHERFAPVLMVEGFRIIPGYPGYSMNIIGDIYDERQKRFVEHDHTESVNLWKDGIRVRRSVRKLIWLTFPDKMTV